MPKKFPEEFRRDVIAVARRGEAPVSQSAKDFGISDACLHRWLKIQDVEDGLRPGLTMAEQADIRELKKRNRLIPCRRVTQRDHAATTDAGASIMWLENHALVTVEGPFATFKSDTAQSVADAV